jgi:hypothetical protein
MQMTGQVECNWMIKSVQLPSRRDFGFISLWITTLPGDVSSWILINFHAESAY